MATNRSWPPTPRVPGRCWRIWYLIGTHPSYANIFLFSFRPTHPRARGLFDTFSFDVDLTPVKVEVMGDFPYVLGQAQGNLTPRNGDPLRPIHFTMLWLLRTQPDGWKIARQVWNSKPIQD